MEFLRQYKLPLFPGFLPQSESSSTDKFSEKNFYFLAMYSKTRVRGSSLKPAYIGAVKPIVFAGGGARNQCLVQMMEGALKSKTLVPAQPQMLGALGAALIAAGN